ncbi:MAG: MarR family winged helix-turn-helix transcriptional regulator [Actinocatenispora sp.]
MSTPSHSSAEDQLTRRTGYVLLELGKAALARADGALAALGITARHLRILTLVASGVPSQQGMVAWTGIDRTTMVTLVDDLERLGCVQRRRDPADRRRHLVVVTDAGRRALSRATEALDRAEAEMLAGLNRGERRQLHDLATRVLADQRDRGPLADSEIC